MSSLTPPPSPAARAWSRVAAWLVIALMWSLAGLAWAQGSGKFDHLKTGFALTGAHTTLRCESCHVSGVFKGTPKDCRSCHSQGGRAAPNTVVLPSNHIPTTLACETCHVTQSFTSVQFSHTLGISPGQGCASCHDGVHTQGKNATHIVTRAACDTCHTTNSWDGARPDHSAFNASTNCASCHNGSAATGKPGTHIPVTANCTTCHGVTAWKPTQWNHTQTLVAGACSTCHTGSYPPADGKPGNHIPYASISASSSANCDSCHKSGYSSWNPGQFHTNFTGISAQCSTCHTGSFLGPSGKTGDHIPYASVTASASAGCETCHKGSTTSWANGLFHNNVTVATQCATCHTGAYNGPDGKPGNHIPYTSVTASASAGCETCHKGSFTSWATGKFHSNVSTTAQCASCHLTGAYGQTAMPGDAIHTGVTGGCESCHNTSSWASSAKPDHSTYTAATNCGSCHNGSTALGKSSTHIPTTVNCYSCHNTTSFTPSSWNHTQMTVKAACSTCHTGSYPPADGKPGNHIPYASISASSSANCDSCHKSGYSSWNPGQFHANFTGISAQCSTCHTGSFLGPSGKPGNHIPYASVTASASAGCETCHKGSFTSWANGLFHNNVTTTAQCATCHLTSAYGQTAKPADAVHASVTSGCESCHTTSTWTTSARPDHSTYTAATNCVSCHNGSTALGKSSTHIPTTVNCYSCHNTTSFTPSSWNHTQMTVKAACSTCHTGSYPPADGKPANHIPYTSISVSSSANCDSCHKSGYSSWNPGQFHVNFSVATQCSTCHTGAYNGPDGKPGNHIPYASVTASASAGCETCHKGSFTSWANGLFHNNVTTTAQCASCHLTSAYGQTAKPNDAMHASVTGGCESCHTTSTWTTSARPDHSTYTAATNCGTCHNGSTATGKPSNHIPTTVNCYSCHNVTSFSTSTWNHTQMTVRSACSTCHTGSYPPADGKPSNHIPYASISVSSSANCDSCHKSGYTSWNPGQFHANLTVATQCSTCHTGAYNGPDGKPGNHIPYASVTASASAGCETCHKGSFTSWANGLFHNNVTTTAQCASCHLTSAYGQTAKPNDAMHASVTGGCESCHTTSTWTTSARPDHSTYTAATNCGTCHNGSTATGKPSNHIPTTVNCYSCHNVTSFSTSTWNHTQMTVRSACSTCHTGSYPPADGKPSNHIPYASISVSSSANCDSCHKSGYTNWNPGQFHANFTVTTQCAICHTGAYNGPDGKPSNHIPYASISASASAGCETCHKGSFTSWATGKFHSNVTVTGQCNTCHSSSAYGQTTKPSNHIPLSQLLNGTSMDCSACHTSTVSGGFASATMNHNSSQGNGAGWCYACHNTGTSYLGNMTRNALTHNKRTGVTDCSQSGCHRPLGTRGTAYRSWD